MREYQLGAIESQFADLVWENEPITAADLARRCEDVFHWKKTTAYTVLKRLSNKGLFETNGGVVTSRITRQDFYSNQSREYVDSHFDGDFPSFLAAFTAKKRLTAKEVAALRKIVAEYPAEGEEEA